jgi:single-strand DNA-binding protein
MNKAILIGNLTDDPKTSVTANGVTKCTFRLATQRKYTNQQTGQREADFHNIVVWRQLADLCAKYLAKGRKCSVEGTIQYRSFDAQDGSKRYVTEIVAESVEFLTSRQQSAGQTGQPGGGYTEQDGFVPVDDEDLPF